MARWKEIIKHRAEIYEIETHTQVQHKESVRLRSGSLRKSTRLTNSYGIN